MSVDTLRETFHINRINPSEIDDFLSAQTYRLDITNAYTTIRSKKHAALQSLCATLIKQGPTPVYDESGVACLKSKHTVELICSEPNDDLVSVSWAKDHQDEQVIRGDIVITRKGVGTIGRVSLYFEETKRNTDDSLFKVTVTKADSAYVATFLRTFTGQRLLEKGVYGSTGQLSLSSGHIRRLPILMADDFAQKYIGDKVRQAEQLRAWAKELREDVDVVLDQFNLPTSESPAMVNRVSTTRLDARLDPRPYRTHFIAVVDRIKEIENNSVTELADLASGCPVSSGDFVEAGEVPLVRIRNIGFDEFIDLDTGVTKSLHADEAKYQAKENMIVLGMDGIFRAQFFLNDELPMLVNQRVAMLTANGIRAELLTHWLNRPEGQMQLNQWAVKTTVEHTSLSDIGRVLIPRLGRNAEDGLAEKLLSARQAYRYSRFLTTCAKFLVEALIEGQLSEAELIAAEQALQTGNDQPDRHILSRLKTDGIDGQGQPLFNDLDQLYSLVEQASHS